MVHEMYVQLTEKDRKVIEYRWHGTVATKDASSTTGAWEVSEDRPQVLLIVREPDAETYQVLCANEETEAENKWQLLWRDDRFDKALRYFTDMVGDFEIEEVHRYNALERKAFEARNAS